MRISYTSLRMIGSKLSEPRLEKYNTREEYELILLKKSKLSANQRREVIKSHSGKSV